MKEIILRVTCEIKYYDIEKVVNADYLVGVIKSMIKEITFVTFEGTKGAIEVIKVEEVKK